MRHLEGTPTGAVLAALRAAKGYNQRALAAALGVDQASVVRYEKDRRTLPRDAWIRGADAMGLKAEGVEPGAEEDHPLWLIALADLEGAGAFAEVRDDSNRIAVVGDGELACATAGALTALGGLHAFALPVWSSWITEHEGPDAVSLTVSIPGASAAVNDLASRRRAGAFIAGALAARLRHAVVSEGLERVEEVAT